jgi:hypothetical protein
MRTTRGGQMRSQPARPTRPTPGTTRCRAWSEPSQSQRQLDHDNAGVIEGIAFQTNILALNAAVEAARARKTVAPETAGM